MTTTVQFLIDTICANFTVKSLYELVMANLDRGTSTIDDLAAAIMQKDRTLDIGCARGLAMSAISALEENGQVEVREEHIYLKIEKG
ncbi:MAG: hypothetical protein Q8O55_00460 [Dehalococcoidales bacterium]|nr:hypothetical protein [Dehalococcoidales bacterium]